MRKQFIFTMIISLMLVVMVSTASALTISWDQPPDEDLQEIQVFVCNEGKFLTQACKDPVAIVPAPGTSYDATGVVGSVWFIRILAMDYSKNKSGWSDVIDNVNPGIPGGLRVVVEVEVDINVNVNIE